MARIFIAALFLIDKIAHLEVLHVSGFQNGPFALPMSKDGCPGGQSKGWKTGYINITTTKPLDDPQVYIESCQHAVKSFRHSENVTSVLGPFDKYNVQLNFCFKMEEEDIIKTYYSWFGGTYGIFGTSEGCPSEFSTQNMSICVPPLLHYNIDGNVPYFNLVDTNEFTDLQFVYCKHTRMPNNLQAKSYNPFMVLKDVSQSKSDCPNIDGFKVTVDHLPVPLPVRVMNDLGEWYPYFQLEFCHFMSEDFVDDMNEDIVQTIIDNYGYPGDGYAFIRPSLITKQCDGKMEIDIACENIETWVMLDAGQSTLVSGVLLTELEYIYLEHLKTIFVGEDKWSFIREGAFLCRHARSNNSSIISYPVIFGCQKSIYGRFVTLVFESNVTVTGNNDGHYQDFFMALSKTFVAILSYDLDKVNTIRLKSMELGDDERVVDYINKTLQQTEFYHERCNQDLGMRHSIILDEQVTASSWKQHHSPTEARPHLSGWCADSSDVKPYIQVEFEELTIIDGIEITNWYEVVTNHENNVHIQTSVVRGCSSFYVDYASSSNIFTSYNKKAFVYDESRIIGEPQHFMFTNPFHARYLRIFPSSYETENEPCLKFEIFGCRMKDYNATTFRLDANRRIIFNVKSTNITELGESISFNYPFSTDFNAIFTWRIQIHSKNAFLQFAFISLRKSQKSNGGTIFVNNHICEDVIILSTYDVTNDILSALTQNTPDLNRIESSSNGKVPAFSMKNNSVTFLTLFACSTEHIVDESGGFKVHVTNRDYAICDASYFAKSCTLPEMNLISHNFLGRQGFQIDRHQYIWTLETSTDSIELQIEIVDFDISCNSETLFEISGVFVVNKITFCNANRPHGVVPLVAGPTNILYKPYYSNLFSSNPFSEGFQLKYQFVPREKTIKENYENIGQDEVCVDAFKKCYIFRTASRSAWLVAATNCKRSDLALVNLKSVSEQQFLRALLLERYRKISLEQGIVTKVNPSTATSFIGLTVKTDKYAGHGLLQYWTDGTPMTFSAWDEGEPEGDFDHHATEMSLHPLENINPWKKISFTTAINRLYVYACEKSLNSTIKDSIKVKYEILQTTSDSYTLFKCGGGEYISKMALCNGVKECSDASDEANCTSSTFNCNLDEFQCNNGRCIHISKFCNYEVDCDDAEDEECDVGPCRISDQEFTCSNGQCIRSVYACDGKVDCKDGSDERDCDWILNTHCNENAFSCSDDTCIPKRLVCDMYADCTNGEDEELCKTTYTTCDELWKDGFTKSNYYIVGENKIFVYCDFNFIFTNTTIIMTYLNTDWKQTSDTEYKITTPGVNEALNAGYTCTLKFTELAHREEIMVIEFENLTYQEYEWIYELHSKDSSPTGLQGTRPDNASFVMTPVINDGLYDSFIMQTTDVFKLRSNRLQIEPVVCKKEESDVSESIFCRRFVSPIDVSKKCISSNDNKRNTYGCRSLNHLQNCENFTCPKYHFKCPQSFCVPYMSVCDGIFDCNDGADEEDCGCSNTEKRTILIIYEDYHDKFETEFIDVLALLGGMLYTKNSAIKSISLINIVYDEEGNPYDFVVPPVIFNYDVNSRSHLPTIYSSKFNLFDEFRNVDIKETYGIIWVSDDIDTSYNFYRQPEFTLDENVHKYFVQIDKTMKIKFRITPTQNYSSVVINDYDLLGKLGSTLFPEICKAKYSDCRGMYRCSMSSVCIPLEQVCNAVRNCPYEDDEENCEEACPRGCQCSVGVTNCSGIEVPNYHYMRVSTRILDISNTEWFGRYIFERQHYCTNYKYKVIWFNVSRCKITNIETKSMHCFPNLVTLDLSYNSVETILPNTFSKLKSLRVLYIHGNNLLQIIKPGAFNGLKIDVLNLNGAIIEVLDMNTFYGLNLTRLDLSNCHIQQVKDNAFNGLVSQYIDIQHNSITEFGKSFFTGVLGVEQLVTSAYKYCCVRPAGLSEDKCLPYRDEFSSCEDLMRKTVLRVLMWIIGVMALSGNILSLVYRVMRDRKRFKLGYGIFVTNLAIADMFMGVYMLIIAIADYWFADRYIEVDEKWRNSGICKFAGILSTTSSEASVIFMCLITIDRILVVKYPFGQVRFTTKSAAITCIIGWIISLTLSLTPVIYTGYFKGSFYSKSGVCLALPLTRDRPPGWLYSIVIFIGLNFVTFVLIAVGQLMIYTEIKKTKTVQKSMNVSRSYDLKVARNLLLVVTTDFMCWFPIGVMGILAINGYAIPGEIYAWTAVLILPINSALNPFMYTLSAILGKTNFNPNIEEQTRSENAKEIGRYLLLIHPFVAIRPGIYNEKFCSLSNIQQDQKMTVKQFTCIILKVLKFVEILHENELVLKTLTDDDILIELGKNRKIGSTIKVTRIPVICQDSSDRTDDISLIGTIIRKWLFTLKRNDNI